MDSAETSDRYGDRAKEPDGYRPPRIRRLGTLAELTRGGTAGPDDGLGGAGDVSI